MLYSELIIGLTVALFLAVPAPSRGDADRDAAKAAVRAEVSAYGERAAAVAQQIWEYAELGYQEERSSKLLQTELAAAGYDVQAGVAGMPTAFSASFGAGEPVIGILAEFDALPGLSQDAVPERSARVAGAPGHACGHHLFGAGSVASAIGLSRWLEKTGARGTIRVYGAPAEEGGAGKVYLTRAGLFDDVDAMLHWHAADRNAVMWGTTLANKSAKFRFRGYAAHAAAAPELGRSALDGVEAMTFMVNLLREHVPQETRIHYIITRGGAAPNIVPDFAELYLYLRHPDPETVQRLWRRIVDISEGAARGTETSVDHEVIHGSHSLLLNETLSKLLFENLSTVGGVTYDAEEQAFAEALYETFEHPRAELGEQESIQPREDRLTPGSTDVGDVSWNVPTTGLGAASWIPGTPPHSWQAVAVGGTSIGAKGMRVAAEALAMTAVDLLLDPAAIRAAREEFERVRGSDFHYEALLGDRDPPLDYRR
jgi:aminobenzoyl-glutamate utilization protein B